jgi:hypothetical protein
MKRRNRLFEMLGIRLRTFFERRGECTSNGGRRIWNGMGNVPRMADSTPGMAWGMYLEFWWECAWTVLEQVRVHEVLALREEQADLREKQRADWRFWN